MTHIHGIIFGAFKFEKCKYCVANFENKSKYIRVRWSGK